MSIFGFGGNHPRKLVACPDSSATQIDVNLTVIGGPGVVFDNSRCAEFSIVEDINTNIIAISLSTEDWADERFLARV